MEMKVEKLATQILIKPSSPTPHHQKSFKLSLLDQLSPPLHIRLIFFYPPTVVENINPTPNYRLVLTTSLSEILTQFYPYAGRIANNSSIECTDDGVVYSESEVDFFLSDVLSKRDPNILEQFLPVVVDLDGLQTIPLLIQANFFKGGGFALGVMACHRIMDAGALSTFIRSWANTAAGGSNNKVEAPDFTIPSSLYPPSDFLNIMPERSVVEVSGDACITKRFVFKGSSIAELKIKLGNNPQPTRVESVSALIWKCAMKASQSSNSSQSSTLVTSSMLLQAVNLRKRWEPSLPDNTPGNNSSHFSVHSILSNDDAKIINETDGLVHLFKDGLREFCANHMKKLQDDNVQVRCAAIFGSMQEVGNLLKRDDIDLYFISSWCNFKLYNANFGWGKPEWIGFPSSPVKNAILLMDTKEGDGIEAWITLKEEHMAAFEQDEDLFLYANSPSPSISNP